MSTRSNMARTVQNLRLLAGTALASSLAVPIVYATGSTPDKLKIMDLPIYNPLPAKEAYEFVPHEPNSLENGIAVVRKFIVGYKQSVDGVIDKISYKWEVSKAHTLGLLDYIQNDPSILPRLGIITVAGLGGVVAGYKRGVGRKLTYSTIGLTSAACLCYPNEVSGAAKYSAGAVANQSKKLWHTLTAPPAVVPELPKPEEPVAPKVEEPVAPKVEEPVPPKVEEPVAPKVEEPVAPKVEEPVAPKVEEPVPPKVEEPVPEAAPAPAPAPASADVPVAQVAIVPPPPPPPQNNLEAQVEPPKDFGQSSKDDDDLYTTRR